MKQLRDFVMLSDSKKKKKKKEYVQTVLKDVYYRKENIATNCE